MPKGFVDCRPSEKVLVVISEFVVEDYPLLMAELGLSKADVFRAREDNPGSIIQALYKMLLLWNTKSDGEKTLRQLLTTIAFVGKSLSRITRKLQEQLYDFYVHDDAFTLMHQ